MPDRIIHQRLDTSGLMCPLPVLKAQKILRTMPAAEVIEVISTDPKAIEDFPIFCHEQNYKLLQHSENNGRFVFIIQK
ncbi:MAG: sulfurtransferase TusA family protein [Alphaproteobacteria bacterium]